jgi:DNA-binding transcriptional MerR regulator
LGTQLDLPDIPEKLQFKIGEVSRLVGVKPYVLRYWETEFSQVRPSKSNNGHRVYSRADVLLLRRIRKLLHDRRYTIEGARSLLARGNDAVDAVLAPRPNEAAGELADLREALDSLKGELTKMRAELRAAERRRGEAVEEATFWRERARRSDRVRHALEGRLRPIVARLRAAVGAPDPVEQTSVTAPMETVSVERRS